MEEPDEGQGQISIPDLPTVEPAQPQPLGRYCPSCNRPAPVCLCHVIPSPPILTRTRVVILQHPHESRHPLSTVPVLSRCLINAAVVVRRRLTFETLLATVPAAASTFLYLFPPTADEPSLSLSSFHGSTELRLGSAPVLIAFDATWKHAKEMLRASEDCLRRVSAIRVSLDGNYREDVEGGSMYDGEETLVMRKEPREGYVSTMEAVARALGMIEEGGGGASIEGMLIDVLREMVGLQKAFLKPMKPRVRIAKKKKKRPEDEAQRRPTDEG
ncbi:hypothetical protein MLD38_007576 [Melastoma candidum]|uniref:Uncharacterized protein n=1 Tax=Melastoma candidum TaxID=119954 RepID=A0ACB9RR20_9MYRT|nr:hypothetical protein MLD38_007576 [Melastoma candidum]